MDKAQDLFACLNDMGATVSDSEFLDIILAALPLFYESVMNTLTTSLEEVGKPIEIDSIIRIPKSQYDKRKTQSTSQEEQVFMGTSSKRAYICTNCKKKGHSIETCWSKGSRKEGQGPKQKKRSKFKKKKWKEKENAAEEISSDGKSDGSITFINSNCAAFIKDSIGTTVIIDTGASSYMTLHQNMLKNYQSFPKLRTILAADKGTFNALEIEHLKLSTQVGGKLIDIQLKDTLYAPKITFTLILIS